MVQNGGPKSPCRVAGLTCSPISIFNQPARELWLGLYFIHILINLRSLGLSTSVGCGWVAFLFPSLITSIKPSICPLGFSKWRSTNPNTKLFYLLQAYLLLVAYTYPVVINTEQSMWQKQPCWALISYDYRPLLFVCQELCVKVPGPADRGLWPQFSCYQSVWQPGMPTGERLALFSSITARGSGVVMLWN